MLTVETPTTEADGAAPHHLADCKVRYVGLDVHKQVIECCILAADGEILHRERLALTRSSLTSFAQQVLRPTDRVALEATTNTWAVVRILAPHVAEVAVSNPLTTKAIATAKVKTDKVDALVLAQLLRCDYLPRVWQPDDPTQEMRRLTSRRASLISDRTRIKNRIHAVLAQRLITPSQEHLFTPAGLECLRQLELDPEGRMFIDSELRLLKSLDDELERMDQLLAEKSYRDANIKLLMTLPGVNVAVAAALCAAFGDARRFRSGDQAASSLGLVPSTRQSADRCYHGPITKAGRSHARWMLVQAAHHVRKHPGPLGVFFRRLAKKKNYNVAVVATARKLAVIAWHMLTTNEPYRYAQPKPTQDKLSRLRVKATGKRRKTGPKRGEFATSKLAPGTRSRTIKPLAQVYQEEGLPPVSTLRPGEQRMVEQCGSADSSARWPWSRWWPNPPRLTRPRKNPPHTVDVYRGSGFIDQLLPLPAAKSL
jgi:transposase